VTFGRQLLAVAAAVLVAAGCGTSDNQYTPPVPPESPGNPSQLPDQQAPPDRLTIRVSIAGDQVNPVNEQLQGTIGQPIVIEVSSDVADELHVHSTPEHTFKVEPKSGQSFQFTVDVPGTVDVELHKLNKTIATIQVR
jgi:hypothetical protein